MQIDLLKLVIITLIIVGTVLTAWLTSQVLNRWAKRMVTNSDSGLDDAILHALKPPAVLGVLLFGVWLALQEADFLINADSKTFETIFFILYLALGYLAISRLVGRLIDWYAHEVAHQTETTFDDHILPFLRRVASVIIFLTAMVMLLGHFQVDVTAFVATLGIGSLAIALAGQEVLSNMISGFIIIIDRPFRIGDRIELEELQTWGDVQDIGLHSTRIITRDNRMISVPNALIGKNRVINHSIPSTVYRVQTHVGVAYGIDIDEVRKVLVEAVKAQDWVMTDKPVEALFLEFQDSGLLFRVRCWIEDYVETRRVIDKLNTAIYKALNEADIEIPFPQRVVHLQQTEMGG